MFWVRPFYPGGWFQLSIAWSGAMSWGRGRVYSGAKSFKSDISWSHIISSAYYACWQGKVGSWWNSNVLFSLPSKKFTVVFFVKMLISDLFGLGRPHFSSCSDIRSLPSTDWVQPHVADIDVLCTKTYMHQVWCWHRYWWYKPEKLSGLNILLRSIEIWWSCFKCIDNVFVNCGSCKMNPVRMSL